MGYKVPDWKQSVDQNKFDVETDDGQVFQLPKAEYLTGRQVLLFRTSDELEGGVYEALDQVSPGLGTAMLDVPIVYVKEFIADWQKNAGVTLGESSASATS